MYDGTDVAFVLGGFASAGLAGLCLLAAAIAGVCFVICKTKNRTAGASLSARWAVTCAVASVLCVLSIASGYFVYDLFEHQRGYENPPSHVAAVAIASGWGPVAAVLVGLYCWRGKREGLATGP